MFTDQDHAFMARAIEIAREGLFTTTPNPRVGCVIVRDGQIVGEGSHKRAGEPHAEVLALAAARAEVGADGLVGTTAYVTLEPCNHFGRTPPCVTALLEARVARVIAAMEDPNPQVAGAGLAALRHAGIDVRCGLLRHEAEALNPGFIARMTRGTPWVRLKIAASLDGRTALADGESQWITGEAARADGHAWRARACAVLTGIGTVRDDDPQLNVRLVATPRQPLRVLVDSRLDVPLAAKLLGLESAAQADAPPGVIVYTARPDAAKADALRVRGVEVVELPDARGKVDLRAMFQDLGRRRLNEIHVEAGEKLNGSLLREDCIDEVLAYLAPCLIGPGRGIAELPALRALDDRRRFVLDSVDRVGDDVRIVARVHR